MYEVIRFFVSIFFKTFYRVKVIDVSNVPKEGPVILVSNHESMLDMFMIGYKIKRKVHWMAKSELFKNKLLAAIITWFGAYPIHRGKGDSSSIHTTFDLLKEGKIVGIFPQGTRSKGRGRSLKPKYGAAKFAIETCTIVQPVAIWGKIKLFHKCYVRFGKPFYIEECKEGKYSKDQLEGISQDVMDQIYGMMNREEA